MAPSTNSALVAVVTAVILIAGSEALTEDGVELSGPHVCTYIGWDTVYINVTVSFPCWRRGRPTWCWGIEIRCDTTWVNRDECCEGYERDGMGGCRESIKCYENNGGCAHLCHSDDGDGAMCACHNGYTLVGNTDCQDVDECSEGTSGCNQKCRNTDGHYNCSCEAGYRLANPTTCVEIDECRMFNGGCEHECVNTAGSFYCKCNEGYMLRQERTGESHCDAIDECAESNGGCEHQCVDTPGSFYCRCDEGYALSNTFFCADEDECLRNDGGCSHTCHNTMGGYMCLCPHEGYMLVNGTKCVFMPVPLPPVEPGDTEPVVSEGEAERTSAPVGAIVGAVAAVGVVAGLTAATILLLKYLGLACWAPPVVVAVPLGKGKKGGDVDQYGNGNEYSIPVDYPDTPPAYDEIVNKGHIGFRNETYGVEEPIRGKNRALLPPVKTPIDDQAYSNVAYDNIGDNIESKTAIYDNKAKSESDQYDNKVNTAKSENADYDNKESRGYENVVNTQSVPIIMDEDADIYDDCFMGSPARPPPKLPTAPKQLEEGRNASKDGPVLNEILNARNLLRNVDKK